MKRTDWWYAPFVLGAVIASIVHWYAHRNDFHNGLAAGRADVNHRVHTAQTTCEERAARTRTALEASCTRERETWHQNLSALTVDMEHYEEDLERCRHVRTR